MSSIFMSITRLLDVGIHIPGSMTRGHELVFNVWTNLGMDTYVANARNPPT